MNPQGTVQEIWATVLLLHPLWLLHSPHHCHQLL